MSLRLAVATEDFNTSLRKSIGLAAQLEIDGVRLNTRSELHADNVSASALRQTFLYVQERQMQVAGLACPTKHALYDAEYLEPRLEIIRKSMALARRLKTSELLVRCGLIPDPDSAATPAETRATVDQQTNPFSFAAESSLPAATPAKQFALLCEILNDLTSYGNHVGCVLCLQLAGFEMRLIKHLLNQIKSGPLNVVFDPATAVMTGCDVNDTYRDLYEHVGYVRARDAVRNTDGAGTEVALGAGIVDWVQLIPTLVEADYTGWVCVERTGGETQTNDIRRGVSHVKSLIPQTGD